MIEEKEKYLNLFLNSFLNYHQERNSLLFDNLEVFFELMQSFGRLTYPFIKESSEELITKKIHKTTIMQNMEIISSFYSKLGIPLNVETLINDGTINLTPIILNNSEIIENDRKIYGGVNNYSHGHKYIDVNNNGDVIDSAILVHELSHYRNQPKGTRGQVNDLLTESLAFAEELIYADYLGELGYDYESNSVKKLSLETIYQRISDGYYLLKLYLLYDKLGKVSKDNYKYYYEDDSTYCEAINSSIRQLEYNQDDILSTLWYTLAGHLSIYMYMRYKDDRAFINNIKMLNDSLLNKKELHECLKIIGIDGYTKESRARVEEAIKKYIEELSVKEKALVLK